MKIARRTLQPVLSPALNDDACSHGANSSSQLAMVAGKQSATTVTTKHTRALSRKTRGAVEAWIEKLFVSDRQKKQSRELTRRASTGSLPPVASIAGPDAPTEKTRRRSSLFSRNKENSSATSNTKSKRTKDKTNKANKDSASSPLWLQPVTNSSQVECEHFVHSRTPQLDLISSASDVESSADKPPELLAYVTPPVEMPSNYRQQDRRGGMIVSGRAVLFTNAAFKRKLRNLSQLRAIPENQPAQMLESRLDVYLTALEHLECIETPVSSSTSDDVSDIIPLSQWV
ncbi:hypothetical protein Gpo141_00002248 [Globisporangium polare]